VNAVIDQLSHLSVLHSSRTWYLLFMTSTSAFGKLL
jgi:hypothetical protein